MKRRYRLWTIYILVVLLSGRALYAQDVVSDLLGRINNLRASLGLAPYTLNAALSAAAQSQAQWMVDTGSVTHAHPDGSTPRTRAQAAGYPTNWVSENIYMGSIATVNDAWTFWIHSPIHYAGLTNPNYHDVGIGTARNKQSGASFVLVFGNPSSSLYVAPAIANSNNQRAEPPKQPSYVVGVDAHGNIMHEVQDGDTLGQIALYYGYTWADIPAMLALNHLSQEDARHLEVGSIFLVPPKAGTYTPTPVSPEAALTMTAAAPLITSTMPLLSATPSSPPPMDLGILPTSTPESPPHIATASAVPNTLMTVLPSLTTTPEATAAAVGDLPTAAVQVQSASTSQIVVDNRPSIWLIAAVILQVGVVIAALIEFVRRARR
jgi:hypothetical protein